MTFGLNALYGRHQIRKGVWGGAWDSSNARDFMNYTVSKGYKIDSWEYGTNFDNALYCLDSMCFSSLLMLPLLW